MNLMLAHGDGDIFGAFCWWTFLLRFGQYTVHMVPVLLTGVLLAGLLRTRTGRNWLLAGLDASPTPSMLRAAVLGLVAPVGALGALPIASEMLRARIRPSVVLCFLVPAPLFMPWSFGYAADSVGLVNASLVVSCAFFLALLVGAVARIAERSVGDTPPPAAVVEGSQLLGALRAAARISVGWILAYTLVAVGSSAALAAILEPGSIETHLGESSVVTLFELSVPITLANITPDVAVMLASEFWRIGLLTGGVFLVFYSGGAWSLGAFAWSIHRLKRTGLIVALVWLFLAMGISALGNSVLRPPFAGEPDSHGFDTLTQPHNLGGGSPAAGVVAKLRRSIDGNELAITALILLFIAGAIDRLRYRHSSTAPFNEVQPANKTDPPSLYAIHLSLLGAFAVCMVVSVYSYFPPPEELRERLRLQSGNLYEAASTLDSAQYSREEQLAAKMRALNALDRIDDSLVRYPASRAIRFASSSVAALNADQLRRETQKLKLRVEADSTDQLSTEALELVARLARD